MRVQQHREQRYEELRAEIDLKTKKMLHMEITHQKQLDEQLFAIKDLQRQIRLDGDRYQQQLTDKQTVIHRLNGVSGYLLALNWL